MLWPYESYLANSCVPVLGPCTRSVRPCCFFPALSFFGAQNQDLYRAELRQTDTVVSCVGGFGKTDAYMGLINGEANIKLVEVRSRIVYCCRLICVLDCVLVRLG